MKTTVRVEGLAATSAALEGMSKATQRSTLYRVLYKAAAPMDAAWRANAPVLTGRLKKSGGVVKSSTLTGNAAYGRALAETGDKAAAVGAKRTALRETSGDRGLADLTVGPGRNPEATQQEFGNSRHVARPYFRPAWDATKDVALEIIRSLMAAEVAATAARVAKTAARKAAKLAGG